jgi:hypothetical protein
MRVEASGEVVSMSVRRRVAHDEVVVVGTLKRDSVNGADLDPSRAKQFTVSVPSVARGGYQSARV